MPESPNYHRACRYAIIDVLTASGTITSLSAFDMSDARLVEWDFVVEWEEGTPDYSELTPGSDPRCRIVATYAGPEDKQSHTIREFESYDSEHYSLSDIIKRVVHAVVF